MIFSCHAASFCPLQPHFWACHAPLSLPSHSSNQMSVFDPFSLFAPSRLLYFFHPATSSTPLSNSFTPSLSSQVLEGVVESRSEVVGNLTGSRVTLVEGNPSRTAGHSSQQSREAPTAPRKRYTAKIELLPSNQRSKYISPSRRREALWVEKR